ncbi:hypothetical protein [Periweissella ghanensis]|uniref:Uncharacterized protein n=1 Tax=Periweissella ghanensis TaxID=467997 RepID=A0ABM8Z9L9_9LACO|nr:hypothetical protein [Periweissella ghanensis]MCM0601205.1 hypothetical protein [Periweissella ghanensis]CAH0418005.1 hypothetical protein WGH24286_00421 [Periweissella ghanensis]
MKQNFITEKLMNENEVVIGVIAQKKTTLLGFLTDGVTDEASYFAGGNLTNRFYVTKNNEEVLLQGFKGDGELLFAEALPDIDVNTFKKVSRGKYNYKRIQQYK